MRSSAHGISHRTRRIWLACLGTILGIVLTTIVVARIDTLRETDAGDPNASITATDLQIADSLRAPCEFQDVTQAMGIEMRHGPGTRNRLLPEDTGSGLAWGDYDNDRDWDLYVVNFGDRLRSTSDVAGHNRLYRNDGGHFTDVTDTSGVADPEGFGMGASWADFDDDGDQDLYVTNFGPNRLYRNRGDGTFEEIGATAGVADSAWSTGAAWGDFDRDGHLDLYVCNYLDYDLEDLATRVTEQVSFGRYSVPFTLNPNSFDPVPNRLYRNRGDGTFEEMAELLGVSDREGRSLAATFCDLDGDGWLDLYVANDVSENKLFRNLLGDPAPESLKEQPHPSVLVAISAALRVERDGAPTAFADLSAATGTADPRGSMGISVGELGALSGQPDDLPDLFITHWMTQENALYVSHRIPNGMLEYRDKTRQYRLGEVSIDRVGWGCALADLDLDGRADLLVANGSTLERSEDLSQLVAEPLFFFWNDGQQFQNVTATAGPPFARTYCARGLAVADFDDDGDVDFALSDNRAAPRLIRNEYSQGKRFLKVRLQAPAAACFGARVTVTTEQWRMIQWFGSDVSYLSMHAPELVFGLGSSHSAAQVEIRWADGTISGWTDVAAGTLQAVHPRHAVTRSSNARGSINNYGQVPHIMRE